MKFVLSTISIIMLLSVIAVAQPKIEVVSGETHDWGLVQLTDSPLKTKVQIKNVGNEDLVIEKVKPSCGCTTAPLDKDVLKPNETANIDVELKVSHAGPISKNIRISSNDPSGPTKIIRLKAEVQELLAITPSKTLRFRHLKVGEESSAKLTLHNKDSKPITISTESIDPENMKISFVGKKGEVSGKTVIAPGEKIELKAIVTPDKEGYFQSKINLTTDHKNHKNVRISGFGNVKSSPIFNK